MRTPARAAALLTCGTLDRQTWPELADPEFGAEVRHRLAEVGLELVSASGRWLARPQRVAEESGFEPAFSLNAVELAVLAALYLHLRFLPQRQESVANDEPEPSVAVDDIVASFPGYQKTYLEGPVLGRLRNAGFVHREEGRLYAGPYLAAIDEVAADERCTHALDGFLLRRYLKRKAEEIDAAPDDHEPPTPTED